MTDALACLSGIISIHALREEGDGMACAYPRPRLVFLSTPSARRATRHGQADITGHNIDFYPRPPRGGRRLYRGQLDSQRIHFYPRPPRGGRRLDPRQKESPPRISIHALREEGDLDRPPAL